MHRTRFFEIRQSIRVGEPIQISVRKSARRFTGWSCVWLGWIAMALMAGCGTTTTRLATEQLLMSDAVDQAISEIHFHHLTGKKVYLDTLFLHSVKGVGFVNSEYIISSLRQQLTAAGCLLQDTRDAAEVIVEPRVGALGTDGHEVVYGIPQTGAINSAAAIFSSTPMPAIPEISFGKSNAQSGIAKIIVFAYDRETREPVWQSGIAKAESTSRDTWFLGAGPFQKGSIYEGLRFAGKDIPPPPPLPSQPIRNELIRAGITGGEILDGEIIEPPISNEFEDPSQVPYHDPHVFTNPWDDLDPSLMMAAPRPGETLGESGQWDPEVKPATHQAPDAPK